MKRRRLLPILGLAVAAVGTSIAFQNCAPTEESTASSRSPASDFRDFSAASGDSSSNTAVNSSTGKDPKLAPSSGACMASGVRMPTFQPKPECPMGSVIFRRSNYRQGNVENHLVRVFQASEFSGSAYSFSGDVTIEIGDGEGDVNLIIMAYQPIRWTIKGRVDRVAKVDVDGYYCHLIEGVDGKKIHRTYKYADLADELNFTSSQNRMDGGARAVERAYGVTLTSSAFSYDSRCADNVFYIR